MMAQNIPGAKTPIQSKQFHINETNNESPSNMIQNTNAHSENADTVESHQPIPSNVKFPIEMNTYIQLEIDNNNHACIPRICRFCVAKLTLNSEHSSVILGIKLDASKRSIRTVDIPLRVDPNKKEFNHYAALDLNYNIAYPHFLKKENFIYFYVQKRKKLKNRTILGFKTLAFTAIDLSSILQKSFTSELPLFYFNNKIPLILNNSQHIIGSLKILSLASLPLESVELENTLHFNKMSSRVGKHCIENEDLMVDDDELENIENLKEDSENNKCGFISESDLENETVKGSKKEDSEKAQNPKNFTSKILSFIKKLRNENLTHNGDMCNNDDVEEDEEGDYEYEFDSIEQVSDYDNSDSDDSNADLYSIVSTPKPKLEPFFKNNSNPDLRSLNSNNFLLKIKNTNHEGTEKACISFDSTRSKKTLKKNRSSSLNNSFQEKNCSKLVAVTENVQKNLKISRVETYSLFLIENNSMKLLVESKIPNELKTSFFIDLKNDMKSLLDLILKLNIAQNSLELILIGPDTFFNEFLKFYVEHLNVYSKILHVFYIPFDGTGTNDSVVAAMLGKFSLLYCNYFNDHFWTNLTFNDLIDNSEQVITRIEKFLETGRSNHYKKLIFQVGELILDESDKKLPFIAEIKIEQTKIEDNFCLKSNSDRKMILSTSSSLPQFFNNMTSSNSLLINANPLVDSEYLTNIDTNENDSDLQLDYWRIERILPNTISGIDSYNSDEYSSNKNSNVKELVSSKSKIKKRSISGHFKNILIYRKPTSESQNFRLNKNFDKFISKNFQASINCAKSHTSDNNTTKTPQEFLSLDYALKEKKQKMRLSSKKSGSNQKEINKISRVNLKQLDSNFFNVKLDGTEIKNLRSIEVSCDYENKCFQLHLIIS